MTKILREGADSADRESSRTAPTAVSHAHEAQHSPLPWRRTYDEGDVVIAAADHMWIAAMQKFALGLRSDDGTRNAAFIVTACNNHEALVAALRRMARMPSSGNGCRAEQCIAVC